MLNPRTGERELCYLTIVDDVTPIDGYDRVELAHVGGWTIVVGKGEFKKGDPAVYFEIDSKLPEVEPFVNMEFLSKKKYKIKTQKMCKSISQGLLISVKSFGWEMKEDYVYNSQTGSCMFPNDETRFLTKELNVTYATSEDNKRKASSVDKYKKMAQRHGKLFSYQPFRWLMKRKWGKKLLFIFFGRKRDKRTGWPEWVKKTDEERIENLPFLFEDKSEWIATEKIDGTSTTFTIKRGKGLSRNTVYVCSRNVVFDTPDKRCYYETNVYTEMAKKYNVTEVLEKMLKEYPKADWITIQGETFGKGVQKRDYNMKEHDFRAFNLIMSNTGRWNTEDMAAELSKYGIPSVPIICPNFVLPNSLEELRNFVNSAPSAIDGEIKEGIVFRSQDGIRSFKCVSPEFLIKYHQ